MKAEQYIYENHRCKYVDTETNVNSKNANAFLQYSRAENYDDLDLSYQEQERKGYQKWNEILVISLTDTCANPWAMMIEPFDATVAVVTVWCSGRAINVATVTELES